MSDVNILVTKPGVLNQQDKAKLHADVLLELANKHLRSPGSSEGE